MGIKSFSNYLTEGSADIQNMMKPYLQDEKTRELVKKEWDWAKRVLKKSERIVWWMRFVRLRCIFLVNGEEALKKEIDKVFKLPTEKNWLKSKVYPLDIKYYLDVYSSKPNQWNIANDREKSILEHYFSIDYPKFETFVFGNKIWDQVRDGLQEIEKEYQEKYGDLIPEDDYEKDNKVVIDFNDGYKWFLLPRAYCKREGDAMGHCGNAEGRSRTTDRLLSLRKEIKQGNKTFWEPHLTFQLREGGLLGEMKGKGNEKPVEKYHKYIVPLLKKTDLIKGIIQGAGYAPENDFKLADLSDAERDEVIDVNPNLMGIKDYVQKFGEAKAEQDADLMFKAYNTLATVGLLFNIKDSANKDWLPRVTVENILDQDYFYIAHNSSLSKLLDQDIFGRNQARNATWAIQQMDDIDTIDLRIETHEFKNLFDELKEDEQQNIAEKLEVVDEDGNWDEDEVIEALEDNDDLKDLFFQSIEAGYQTGTYKEYHRKLVYFFRDLFDEQAFKFAILGEDKKDITEHLYDEQKCYLVLVKDSLLNAVISFEEDPDSFDYSGSLLDTTALRDFDGNVDWDYDEKAALEWLCEELPHYLKPEPQKKDPNQTELKL